MIQFLAYVILSQKKDIFFAIYRIINWMSIFSHKNLWAFKTLNAYQKVSCVWMLCRLFECILIKKWVLVGEYHDFFDKWICTDNEELSFGKYAIIGSNIDDLWENAGILDFEWSLFTSVAKRLTTIGSSEADVERLFSQQKVAMGRHMNNIGTSSLKSRLILRTSK